MNTTNYQDKNSTMMVLGALVKDPTLLEQVAQYPIGVTDFPSQFEKAIFGAVNNLYANGVKEISIMEIDSYLTKAPNLHKLFSENNGIQYLNDAVEIASVDNYKYHHSRLRKFSAMRQLEAKGISCEEFYPTNLVDPRKRMEVQQKFDEMEIGEIFNRKLGEVLVAARSYNSDEDAGGSAADGVREMLDKMRIKPEIGPPLQGIHFNTIIRGARGKILHLNSGSTGSGKSRRMVGDAVHLSIPFRFEPSTGEWVETGNAEKVLLITTELTKEEVRTLILAYLTGINEHKFLSMEFSREEEAIVAQAVNLLENFGQNLFLERVPDPTVASVTGTIRQYVGLEKVGNIFFDYVFASQGLRSEFYGLNMRTDEMLLAFVTELKNVANELDVFISTATQLSGDFEAEADGVKNEKYLRGAKSMADKIDFGEITLRISKKERMRFEQLAEQYGVDIPTHVSDIYKVRRSPYNQVRVWWKMDLGTCRMETVLVTDAFDDPIEDFQNLYTRFQYDYIPLEKALTKDAIKC